MDVYDFDGTLYRPDTQGDSTADFLGWCLRRHPRSALTLPRTGIAAAMCYGAHAIDKTRFKKTLYRFLTRIPDVNGEVARFWEVHETMITGPCHPKPGDLVISAGPEFLLCGVCAQRGLELIASKVDPVTGRILSPNCSGPEKVVRFAAAYPDAQIDRFFSDSHNDDPLAALAREAFLVHAGRVTPWDPSGK